MNMTKNISRLYDDNTGIIIAYEIYEGDIEIYVNECVFDGTDICPSVSDMEEYGVTDKWSLEQLYYDVVKEYLKECAFE